MALLDQGATEVREVDAALECISLSLRYGATPVLEELDLEVARGEAVALLGPSGSGKTSLLAAVAGFVPIASGELRLRGGVIARDTPPEARPVAMVFQNYALWPHLTALEIVAYPLLRSGRSRGQARAEAQGLLDRVGVGELGGRRPGELSGGQQQRVGLARALARTPVLYLFDEPTAHLDSALRTLLQEELVARQRDAGAASLYATHDPQEALGVADRVALLHDGRIAQIGTPQRVYEEPVSAWSARLTGAADVLQGQLLGCRDAVVTLRLGGVDVAVAGGGATTLGPVDVVVRPEWASIGGRLPGTVRRVRYMGSRTTVHLDTPAGAVWVDAPAGQTIAEGTRPGWALHRAWLVER